MLSGDITLDSYALVTPKLSGIPEVFVYFYPTSKIFELTLSPSPQRAVFGVPEEVFLMSVKQTVAISSAYLIARCRIYLLWKKKSLTKPKHVLAAEFDVIFEIKKDKWTVAL